MNNKIKNQKQIVMYQNKKIFVDVSCNQSRILYKFF